MEPDAEETRLPTLLVVDDEVVQRLIVTRAAEEMGFAVSGVATLGEAVAWLTMRPADVVVLDLSLGEHDGIELLRDLARLRRDPVIIFLSGFDERVRATAARLAVALGLRVAGTLGKPLQLDGLSRMLGEIPNVKSCRRRVRTEPLRPSVLAEALDRGEVHCMFQPKFILASRRIVGFEALARWGSPTLGNVPPDVFIPVAERYGLIDRITLLVLTTAMTQLHAWHATVPALEMAVNLSPVSLSDLSLPERIGGVLANHHVQPKRLVLEVTERAVMTDYIAAADILTRLRIQGIGISVDDFGTGHSSLLSLLRLPFGELKIDQSFVRGLLQDNEAPKIVRAIVSLAASMDLRVIAEGVEKHDIAERLMELGAVIGQGFLCAPALSAADATALLSQPACTG